MNETNEIKIVPCVPPKETFDNFEGFMNALISASQLEDGDIWGGFFKKKHLRKALSNKIHPGDQKQYKLPEDKKIAKIKQTVLPALQASKKILPNPANPPFRVFVYPWFPNEDEQEVFDGSMGTAFLAGFFHAYMNFEKFSDDGLEKMIAHEYNHTVYYHHFHWSEHVLLDSMIMEGLAEHFRADVAGGDPPPWATAIKKNEVKEKLEKVKPHLQNSTDDSDLYAEVFYGSGEYERWLGYSLGYWIVDSYLDQNPDKKWPEIMQTKAVEICQQSGYDLAIK